MHWRALLGFETESHWLQLLIAHSSLTTSKENVNTKLLDVLVVLSQQRKAVIPNSKGRTAKKFEMKLLHKSWFIFLSSFTIHANQHWTARSTAWSCPSARVSFDPTPGTYPPTHTRTHCCMDLAAEDHGFCVCCRLVIALQHDPVTSTRGS